MNAYKFFIAIVVLKNSLKIFDLANDLKIAIYVINCLQHIINIWKAFDLDLIIELIEVLLKLPVFRDFTVDPKIGNFFDEILFELLRFCKEVYLKILIGFNILRVSLLIFPVGVSFASCSLIVHYEN